MTLDRHGHLHSKRSGQFVSKHDTASLSVSAEMRSRAGVHSAEQFTRGGTVSDISKPYAFGLPPGSKSPFADLKRQREQVVAKHADNWMALMNETRLKRAALKEAQRDMEDTDNRHRAGWADEDEAQQAADRVQRLAEEVDSLTAEGRALRAKILTELEPPHPTGFDLQDVVDVQNKPWLNPERITDTARQVGRLVENDNMLTFSIIVDPSMRGFQLGPHISIEGPHRTGTIAHEMGHIIEYYDQGANDRAHKFLQARTQAFQKLYPKDTDAGEPQSLKEMFPDRNYRVDEEVLLDHFQSPYSGKLYDYGDRYPHEGIPTEITSMGIERLFLDPIGFAIDDPDYFDFIRETLSGRNRYEKKPAAATGARAGAVNESRNKRKRRKK